MKAYPLKYVELADRDAEKLAKRWVMDVQNNNKTPTYKSLNEEKIILQCAWFYRHFSKMFIDDIITEDVQKYFKNYATECYVMGIPMAEALYALILMRRQIWLYSDFQMIFSSGIDQQQALDTLNRTVLLFDYATYDLTREYQELMRTDRGASIKLLNVLEANRQEIAGNWASAVKKDRLTIHYHDIPKAKLLPQAIEFYSQLRYLLFAADRFERGHEFFLQYAKTCHGNGIPLHESIYALDMMRRHMWLYDKFQTIFINVLARDQAIDSLMRVMLMIDYAVFDITRFYQDYQV